MIDLLDGSSTFNGIMAQIDRPGCQDAFRTRPYGITDPFDLFTAVQYQLRDVVGQISTPLLLTSPRTSSSGPASPTSSPLLTPARVLFTGRTGRTSTVSRWPGG